MSADDVILSVSEAAWLLRRPLNTFQRWRSEAAFSVEPLTWAVLQRIATERKATLLDPEWLHVTPDDPPPSVWRQLISDQQPAPSGDTEVAETDRLRATIADLESDLADARANIDSLDVAVMAFRDNWRRDADRADRAQRAVTEHRRRMGS